MACNSPLLYSDDTVLISAGNDAKIIEADLNAQLKSVSRWLVANKLSLHLGKTESILMATKKTLRKCDSKPC